ncbi:hypothetical protein CASFOL_019024 [Castilleja foliolosa]|uniref:UBN2_3 domain-containing protein n=1 Tax=Castilleja foliolosa TaxID=1961234 RepID=A0ABD3D377_9LAMI
MEGSGNNQTLTVGGQTTTVITTEALERLLRINQQPEQNSNPHIELKLNDQNFALWSDLVRPAIEARGREHHLTGIPTPPKIGDPEFGRWKQSDLQVFTWIIQAMEPSLIGRFIQYPTTKALWDGLNTTYKSGENSLQIFQLSIRANTFSQANLSLEDYYSSFQEIWQEIDRRKKNPMKSVEDITAWDYERQEQRLFQFLHGLDDRFDLVKWDLLKETPLPTV